MRPRQLVGAVSCALAASCTPAPDPGSGKAVDVHTHSELYFPIEDGTNHALNRAALDGPIACETCHTDSTTSFAAFTCVSCHEHPQNIIDRLHPTVGGYR